MLRTPTRFGFGEFGLPLGSLHVMANKPALHFLTNLVEQLALLAILELVVAYFAQASVQYHVEVFVQDAVRRPCDCATAVYFCRERSRWVALAPSHQPRATELHSSLDFVAELSRLDVATQHCLLVDPISGDRRLNLSVEFEHFLRFLDERPPVVLRRHH